MSGAIRTRRGLPQNESRQADAAALPLSDSARSDNAVGYLADPSRALVALGAVCQGRVDGARVGVDFYVLISIC